MIESINLKNYKAFDDVTIPIRPLTILLGANSVGKSSILQMLMLLHQTAEEKHGQYTSPLKIYGNYVNTGAFENLFKNKDTTKPLQIRIEITSQETKDLIDNSLEDYVDRFFGMLGLLPLSEVWSMDRMQIKTRSDFEQYINKLISLLNKKEVGDEKMATFLQYRYGIPLNLLTEENVSDIMRGYDIREKICKINDDDYNITFILAVRNGKFKISRFCIQIGEKNTILDVESKTDKNIKVVSDFNINGKDIEYIIKGTNFANTLFNVIDMEAVEQEYASVASFLLEISDSIFNDLIYDLYENRLNYVSPLRAHPKRYYMLDKAKVTFSLDTLDGDAIAEVMKENKKVKKSVNEWFSKFDLNIDVKEFKEVIHHVNVTQNGLPLDITDVGFGISQVLPIIIQGFLSESHTLTIIEQPEIHLHPKMQAEGDLFIDIVKTNDKRLILETHSEYILRRIRRRISEGKISSKDVSICLFHPNLKNQPAWVEQLEIGDKGNFKWPEEYYCGEMYDDIIVYLQNQGNGNDNGIPIAD